MSYDISIACNSIAIADIVMVFCHSISSQKLNLKLDDFKSSIKLTLDQVHLG